MITLVHKRRRYEIPECWDECSPKQFILIVNAITGVQEGLARRLRILKAVLGLPSWRYNQLTAEHLAQLLHLVDWVETDADITRQLVPFINAGGRLYGPAAGFINLTAAEFHFADQFYAQWKDRGDVMDLCRFLAVLYRPSKKGYNLDRDEDGDRRQPFSSNVIEYYAQRLSRQSVGVHPAAVAIAACYCYESWRIQLEKEHSRLFTRGTKSRVARFGWLPVLRAIAKGGQYGPIDKVENMYFGNLLIELEILLDEEAELKAKFPHMFKNHQ